MLLTKNLLYAIIQLTKQLNEEEDKMGIQKTLKALSDPIRRDILEMLRSGRHSAGDISERFSVSAPAISKHLNVLKEADLIRDTREGKYIFYEINTSVLEEVLLWVSCLAARESN
jgi:DNA-binding transcriptional ArsR family regulator